MNDGKYVELFGKHFVLGQFGTILQIRKSISASNEGSMDGDSISGAIRRSQKGLERGQRLPFKKESLSPGVIFDTFRLRRYDRSTIAPVYKSMNAKNATDFSFDYSIRC